MGKATHNGYTLYFKMLPKLPGLEEAVGRWTRNLIGFGAPHVELFRLDSYPVLVSQEIKGLTLKEAIQKHPERLKQLDQKSLAQVLFATMLVNPEDGKPDNYIVEQISDNSPLYRLIGVDNDQAFVPAVAKEQKKEWFKALSVVQVKCILYCLDQMDQPIEQETREAFKNLDPRLLLSTWLSELDLVHQRQVELFANTKDNNALLKKLFQEHDSYVGVPFKKGDLHEFYDRFLRLQKALHDPNVKTYHDLLMRVEPDLGKRYGALRQDPKSPKDLYERFKKIDGKFFSQSMGTITSGKDTLVSKGISEKEAIDDIIKRDRHFTPKLALKELERRVDEVAKMEISSLFQAQNNNIEAFASEEFRNKFFKDLDFNHTLLDKEKKNYGPVSIESQKVLLNGLIPYELHELTLNNCQTLTLPILKTFRLQDLTQVSLTGCAGVTSQVPTYLSGQCLGLVHLNLSQCGYLTYIAGGTFFSSPLPFPNLQKLYINQVPQLTQLNVEAHKLLTLEAKENPNLVTLKVQSTSLKTVNISKSMKITDQILDELEKTCPNSIIHCKNCSQILLPNFRQSRQTSREKQFGVNMPPTQNVLRKIQVTYEKKLISLNLHDTKINLGLVKDLANNTILTCLDLYGSGICNEGVKALSQNTTLKELNLHGNGNITTTEVRALAQNKSLIALDLSANWIGDLSAMALSKNTTLTYLNLDYNKIGDEGAMALSKNTTLTKLNLSRNSIGDKGAKAFKDNTTLTYLSLRSNEIGNEGVKALTKNTTLTSLDLYSNNIDKNTLSLIKEMLERNKYRKKEEEKNNNNNENK